ncbi:DUF6364 family protein [Spirosoma sp. KUDC1026]|uniref:DUF6364 family protein n=1 Tax=Spirosoma sp. KUDC1026 TaxID=2745947 RepID=UPI00159BDAC5|nr:DUF6364 family protein [Spirosoma sp. KUDC1026]QKZ12958.1 hypothetical protein HU175_10065 [Spirosoma sp. KUDC1026]
MGKVKLTLTVDERVVSHAKLLARQQRKSLSAMIEQLLSLDDSSQPDTASTIPTALRLRGIAKGTLSKKTDKQIWEMMYKDRYGL